MNIVLGVLDTGKMGEFPIKPIHSTPFSLGISTNSEFYLLFHAYLYVYSLLLGGICALGWEYTLSLGIVFEMLYLSEFLCNRIETPKTTAYSLRVRVLCGVVHSAEWQRTPAFCFHILPRWVFGQIYRSGRLPLVTDYYQ